MRERGEREGVCDMTHCLLQSSDGTHKQASCSRKQGKNDVIITRYDVIL